MQAEKPNIMLSGTSLMEYFDEDGHLKSQLAPNHQIFGMEIAN